jgi:hypothetical protein
VSQHLVRRDSSIVTGTSVVSLNPDYVSEIRWWELPEFSKRDYLEAAEVIGFEVFDPVLRSRGKLTDRANQLLIDADFQKKMRILFLGGLYGDMDFPDFQDVLEMITHLEEEIRKLKNLK